jgi:CheY-like chemotaxis protein
MNNSGESGKLIFFVDDDKGIINMLEYVFKGKNGYDVRSFHSGEDCLENLHLSPDLVVLDHVLDEMGNGAINGLETLQRLIEKKRDLPVIILSGNSDQQTRDIMLRTGARRVLGKHDCFVDHLEECLVTELGQV